MERNLFTLLIKSLNFFMNVYALKDQRLDPPMNLYRGRVLKIASFEGFKILRELDSMKFNEARWHPFQTKNLCANMFFLRCVTVSRCEGKGQQSRERPNMKPL